MSIVYTTLPHIKNLIDCDQAFILNSQLSSNFAIYIEKNYDFIPVTGYSIDWSNVSNKIQLRWDNIENEKLIIDFINTTTLSKYSQVAIWYGRKQPCLGCSLKFAIKNLELLFASGGGARYIFGIKKSENLDTSFFFSDFVEIYDTKLISGVRLPLL